MLENYENKSIKKVNMPIEQHDEESRWKEGWVAKGGRDRSSRDDGQSR